MIKQAETLTLKYGSSSVLEHMLHMLVVLDAVPASKFVAQQLCRNLIISIHPETFIKTPFSRLFFPNSENELRG